MAMFSRCMVLSVILITLPVAMGDEMACTGGSEAVCKCLLSCDVFGGSASKCHHADDFNGVIDATVREAMTQDETECPGMECVVKCAEKLGCLDENVKQRCLSVKKMKQCEVGCGAAWRQAVPTMVTVTAALFSLVSTMGA
mmetsp:Transcript_22251/g.40094  ORF Transcript_22251/g.40094 Transcript_22251/m.40094 type:complete len:141 (+) Transcript_22251:54-476(+)|eukprot:CAMPEP_0197661060 /NCGR_PEP_ID=MMETSP1338-20131121/51229_1 /TAXON_ID=43686 ORGANISM="Pelagodinium beii, Strain RCC1491" /NCGR_SAMPLE_ID=MMETSP1338 /ASSEMBLY_ACC=CAM_ASM_000754 /LENGTH=140 /DNA_ID=CAMNT_0043238541 /DNA_START=51 /DNA_END=473 /DNA_ORIENTATION=+